jgi:hypothetical protein
MAPTLKEFNPNQVVDVAAVQRQSTFIKKAKQGKTQQDVEEEKNNFVSNDVSAL